MAVANTPGTASSSSAEPPIQAKAKTQNIHVSPAVLDAARKDGDELLQSLRTTAMGLTQTEAEERLGTTGPNEVAQEHKQGWPIRLLKKIRNPLVILLCLELMLNAANLALIGFSRMWGNGDGQVFALIVLVVAACEVTVGLGLVVAMHRLRLPIDVDEMRELQG